MTAFHKGTYISFFEAEIWLAIPALYERKNIEYNYS